MGILSVLLWTPAVGALLISFFPKSSPRLLRWTSFSVSAFTLVLSAYLLLIFDRNNPAFQFEERFLLNPVLGSSYALGVDGIAIPMVLLATLLFCIAQLASLQLISSVKGYFICLLLLEFGVLGVFLARDWLIFFIFWELTLTPLFFLIDRWGGKRRHAASLNFVLYTMGGAVFMQLSLVAVFQSTIEHVSFMEVMNHAHVNMTKSQQILVLLGFVIGFGVKMPLFPFHGWLSLAHVEAPSPVSILLSGVLLKMGAYGLIRSAVMLPDAVHSLQPLLVVLALFGMIYGGLLAWRQSDLKAMVAYSSVSHMAVVLLGIATLNPIGLTGAVLQMTAHGLIAAALFLLVGLLYERTHTREIIDYSGLVQVMPRFAIFMTLTLFAAMGLPGTVGFMAELYVLIGGFERWQGWMVLFLLSILIGATYITRTITQLFTGTAKPQFSQIEDLRHYELFAAAALVIGIYWFGLKPSALLSLSRTSIVEIIRHIGGGS
jgi:NADH-quinone oxidoreductase subunit M